MKKVIALISICFTVLFVAGFVTYALLNTKKEATNYIVYGNIKISLDEQFKDKNKSIVAGISKDRDITVKNVGNNDCYVKVVLDDKFFKDNEEFKKLIENDVEYTVNSSDWIIGKDNTYYYSKVLKAGETTPVLPISTHFSNELSNDYQKLKFNTSTKAFAVQSDNNKPESGKTVADITNWPEK